MIISWPEGITPKNISLEFGSNIVKRYTASGRDQYIKMGDGDPDKLSCRFTIPAARVEEFETWYARKANLGVNWFEAHWLEKLGYTAHKLKITGYPKKTSENNFYTLFDMNFLIQESVFCPELRIWPEQGPGAPIPETPDKVYMISAMTNPYQLHTLQIMESEEQEEILAVTELNDPFDITLSDDFLQNCTGLSADFAGNYLAVTSSKTPFFAWYKRSDVFFTRLPKPSINYLDGRAYNLNISPGFDFAVLEIDGSICQILQRGGDILGSIPGGNIPTYQQRFEAGIFSADSRYIATGWTYPGYGSYHRGKRAFLRIYKKDGENDFSNCIFHKEFSTGNSHSYTTSGIGISPDGCFVAFSANSHQASPSNYIHIYKIGSDDAVTLVNDFSGGYRARAHEIIEFSDDSQYLIISSDQQADFKIYKRKTDDSGFERLSFNLSDLGTYSYIKSASFFELINKTYTVVCCGIPGSGNLTFLFLRLNLTAVSLTKKITRDDATTNNFKKLATFVDKGE